MSHGRPVVHLPLAARAAGARRSSRGSSPRRTGRLLAHAGAALGALLGSLAPLLAQGASADAAPAALAHGVVAFENLPLAEGYLPGLPEYAPDWPFARLEGAGEVYLGRLPDGRPALAVAAPRGQPVRGSLQFPARDEASAGETRVFELPAAALDDDGALFARLKAQHYTRLLEAGLPGAAWFRHQRDAALGVAASLPRLDDETPVDASDWRAASLEDSFALLTGGRAVSENLQLERGLPLTAPAGEGVALADIPGIGVKAYDWSAALQGRTPELDPLAALLPDDQHAVFFPSFEALMAVADHAERHGAPVLAALEPRSESAGTRARYEHQLGLPLSAVARLVGPAVVGSVALTGSDAYLRTGSDVALLLAGEPQVLLPLVTARVLLAAGSEPGAERVQGELLGAAYSGAATPDRSFCSYVAAVGQAVVVTNSLAQLERLLAVQAGSLPALAAAPEYRFFRDRYPRGEAHESAFLVLTDATIRRWCSPRWRIGSSRRSRAAAVLAELQAVHARALLAEQEADDAATVDPRPGLPDIGPVQRLPGGLLSADYGTLGFATPILELDLERVSEEEAQLYERWRTGYEQNWTTWFDPIAARLVVDESRLALDLSVRPLIAGSDYQELIQLAGKSRIGSVAGRIQGDPHPEALVHWVSAIDTRAPQLASSEWMGMARLLAPDLDPLSWVGSATSVYADASPFWAEFAAAEDEEEFLGRELYRLPIALQAEVSDGLKLAAFLTAARLLVEQSAPDMLVWENRQHAGGTYVRVAMTEEARADMGLFDDGVTPPALHYVASGQGFVLSLDEQLVQRAIERQQARRKPPVDGGASAPEAQAADAAPAPGPWLGAHLALDLSADLVPLLEAALVQHGEQPLRAVAWANLPVLDEWRRLAPDRDPLETHWLLWGRRLLCPAGGSYRWNAEDGRMESTLYGHPGRPLDGPVLPPAVAELGQARFGLDFEDLGLRARAELSRR